MINLKRKVDAEVVSAVEQELRQHFWRSTEELREAANQKLGRSDLTETNIRTALDQVPCTVMRQEVLHSWEQGQFHPKEEFLLQAAFSALEGVEGESPKQVLPLLSQTGITALNEEVPASEKTQLDAVKFLLTPNEAVESVPLLIQKMVFCLNLYFWNVPLSRIALWMGLSKSTIYTWVTGLALALGLMALPTLFP
ncbi:hypothetical protein WDW89_21175 [Deltaproteobacteria bacterium TL4]